MRIANEASMRPPPASEQPMSQGRRMMDNSYGSSQLPFTKQDIAGMGAANYTGSCSQQGPSTYMGSADFPNGANQQASMMPRQQQYVPQSQLISQGTHQPGPCGGSDRWVGA